MVNLRLSETSIDMFTFWGTCLQLQKSQAVQNTGGGHTTKKKDRERAGEQSFLPDAESVANFSALEQLCTDVCFHHTFTISICSRNASRRLAFISACKTCPDALKCSPLAASCMGGLY